MDRLLDRVAIITGAGEGIGKAVARRFASEGAAVIIAEIKSELGEQTAAGITRDFGTRALAVTTDVTRKESILAMVEATVSTQGRVDILVNNAWGGGDYSRLERKSEARLERALRMGPFAAFWAMQAVFPHMKQAGGGRIISMCSLNGINAHMYTAEYNVAKEALRTLTRSAAREWGRHNILANIICPAAATPSYESFRRNSPENAAALLKQNPMGRMGDPERDIGGVALFLASDDACYVTGNTIFADGGSHINGVSWAPEMPD